MSGGKFAGLERGWVEVDAEGNQLTIRYELWFVRHFLVVTFMVGVILTPFVLLLSGSSLEPRLLVPVLAWSWLFGGNVAVTTARFRGFLQKTAREAWHEG